MTSYTITYERLSAKAERSGKCTVCGKWTRRNRTFYETVNPFNKDANGRVKTWDQVNQSVHAQARTWSPDANHFNHAACK